MLTADNVFYLDGWAPGWLANEAARGVLGPLGEATPGACAHAGAPYGLARSR